MVKLMSYLENWPKDDNGYVIFKGTSEAIFYAHLIFPLPEYIDNIEKLRVQIRLQMSVLVDCEDVDLDWLFRLACQSQFCRECLEEVQRIQNSNDPGC